MKAVVLIFCVFFAATCTLAEEQVEKKTEKRGVLGIGYGGYGHSAAGYHSGYSAGIAGYNGLGGYPLDHGYAAPAIGLGHGYAGLGHGYAGLGHGSYEYSGLGHAGYAGLGHGYGLAGHSYAAAPLHYGGYSGYSGFGHGHGYDSLNYGGIGHSAILH